jgi:hypothetical protein
VFYDSEGKREKSIIKAAVSAALHLSFILLNFHLFGFQVFGSFGMAALAVNGTGAYDKLRKMFLPFFTFRGYRSI